MNNKNNLPKYWCVRNDGSQLFKDTVIKYMNEAGKKLRGDAPYYYYYGYFKWNNSYSLFTLEKFTEGTEILTIPEFINLTTEFVLPEKWCIKITDNNKKIILNWIKSQERFNKNYLPIRGWAVSDRREGSYQVWVETQPPMYTEITLEQFIQYVVKPKEFVLPEAWYVVVTKENKEVLSKWRGVNLEIEEIVGMCKWNIGGIRKEHNPKNVIKDTSFLNGYDFGVEITFEQFNNYVINKQQTMKEVTGYKLIKKYPGSQAIGYETKFRTLNGMKLADYPEFWEPIYAPEFKKGDWVVITKSDRNWNSDMDKFDGRVVQLSKVDNDANEAPQIYFNGYAGWSWRYGDGHFRKATPAEIASVIEVNLPFGDLIFTVIKGDEYATCSHGTVTKAEVKAVIDWLDKKVSVLGYDMSLVTLGEPMLKFGCQQGSIEQVRAIYNAM